MFKYFSVSICLAFFQLFFSAQVHAQSKSFEGTISYNIILDSVTNEMIFPPELSTLNITAKNNRYTASVFGDNIQVFKDESAPSFLVTFRDLLDGNRYCVDMMNDEQDIPPYEYTDETKEILWYTVKKVLFYSEENQVLEIWITDDIDININQYLCPGLKGFPLEFYLFFYGKYMEVKVQRISREYISDNAFDLPPDCIFTTPDELYDFFSEEETE